MQALVVGKPSEAFHIRERLIFFRVALKKSYVNQLTYI